MTNLASFNPALISLALGVIFSELGVYHYICGYFSMCFSLDKASSKKSYNKWQILVLY